MKPLVKTNLRKEVRINNQSKTSNRKQVIDRIRFHLMIKKHPQFNKTRTLSKKSNQPEFKDQLFDKNAFVSIWSVPIPFSVKKQIDSSHFITDWNNR